LDRRVTLGIALAVQGVAASARRTSVRTYRFSLLTVALVLVAMFASSGTAFAQRRGPVRGPVRPVRSVVFVGVGGFGYPRYMFYDPWYDPWYSPWYGPWYDGWQYPYPRGPYPPGYYRVIDDRTASLRLDVKPRQAEVFVDGYLAGVVDDFDGVFQRLHVRPGEHELVLYLAGYKTVHENLYLNPNSSQKATYTLVQLERGESSGPRPVPANPDEPGPTELRRPEPRRIEPPMGPDQPRPRPPQPREPGGPPSEAPAPSSQNFGTFSIRVLPADAEVLVDGERWMTPPGADRLVIQLSDGKHKVEVRKEGFEKFSSEFQVRRGEATTLNVSLLRSTAARF
jgi:hypothetical protein